MPAAAPLRALTVSWTLSFLAASAYAGPLERIDLALHSGALTRDEAARQRLFALFEPERVDPRFGAPEERGARCATLALEAIRSDLDRLDEETRALYERYTRTQAGGSFETQAVSVHETANFHIEYETTGPDAVPLDDVSPANGVPDYVEKVGEACEFSWTTQVTTLGYDPPPPSSTNKYNGKYLIQFQNQSSYGFTQALMGERTKIVLHPDYVGFPPNEDPDGNVLGAMRVTVAHELKHAIQRTYTPWTEGGWLELDATWMEDVVYDDVNDYYNYVVAPGSPFTEPDVPLDDGGTGSYEDCNWQHYQSELHGNTHVRNFWIRRAGFPNEPVLTTYEQTLLVSGASFDDSWGEYVGWNFASGGRAAPGYGYGEADRYPTAPATSTHTVLPVPSTPGTVSRLAAHARLADNTDGQLGGTPEFTFVGDPAAAWSVSVLLGAVDGTVTQVPIALAGGAATALLTGHDYADLLWMALVIGNADWSGSATYDFSARAVAPLHIAHERPWNTTETAAPYRLVAQVSDGTAAVDPSSVQVAYRVDGGTESSLAMSATGNPDEYEAFVPAQPVGALVEYRIEAVSAGEDSVANPARTGALHAFEVVTVFEPFEADGGWTVGAAGDGATTGVWERAEPVETGAQPGTDFTIPPGTACFVTQNGSPGGGIGDADVDGGRTTLVSPVYDLSGGAFASVTVRYRRWYSNHLGAAVDDVWRVEASNDGGATWIELEADSVGGNEWVPVSADLLALFGTVGQLQFRFLAEDAGAGSIVEALVDDFELIAVEAPAVAVGNPGATSVRLGPAVPNPSQAGTALRLELPRSAFVQAWVHDVSGRRVRSLVRSDTRIDAGVHRLAWDGRDANGERVAPGVYFLRAVVDGRVHERKLVLLR